jgi:hypothetical protein
MRVRPELDADIELHIAEQIETAGPAPPGPRLLGLAIKPRQVDGLAVGVATFVATGGLGGRFGLGLRLRPGLRLVGSGLVSLGCWAGDWAAEGWAAEVGAASSSAAASAAGASADSALPVAGDSASPAAGSSCSGSSAADWRPSMASWAAFSARSASAEPDAGSDSGAGSLGAASGDSDAFAAASDASSSGRSP